MAIALSVRNLTKRYDRFTAVEGIDFEVHGGEILGLLGPNGAGKTTTLKMLAGVMAPTAGEIRLGEIDVVRDPQEAKRWLGYLPQEPYAYEKLTGREFLHFIAEVRSIPVARRATLFEHWLTAFDLTKDADKLLESYSGGMLKKLLLIATLMHEPPVLLLDEPTISLDPLTVRKVRQQLELRAAAGSAIILSTHVLEIAEKLCDRIAIIYGGQLCALGTMPELQAAWLGDIPGTLEDIFLRATGAELDEGALPEGDSASVAGSSLEA